MCGCLSRAPTRDLACNPGMCPDWESNLQPFGSQAVTQSTELHQPGLFLKNITEEGPEPRLVCPIKSGMCKPFASKCPCLGKIHLVIH